MARDAGFKLKSANPWAHAKAPAAADAKGAPSGNIVELHASGSAPKDPRKMLKDLDIEDGTMVTSGSSGDTYKVGIDRARYRSACRPRGRQEAENYCVDQ